MRALAATASIVLLARGAAAAGDMGEALYRNGVQASGAPLQGQSETGALLRGRAAACINCHRRSGLGGREGRSSVPPITGRYLFESARGADGQANLPYVEGLRGNRPPYTEASFARAVREGIDAGGRDLSPLMPRFRLDDAEMSALIAYLRALDLRRPPGISDTDLQLATIITPDADPVARRGMLAVMQQFFADVNAVHFAANSGLRPSGKTAYAKSMFRVHRSWHLHVWQLEGAPGTWQRQLDSYLAREPVFAVLSGLGGSHWAPVQAFCEKAELPCLFPNVEAPPPDAERDFYTAYFSRGVFLEADLMAHALGARRTKPAKVLQVYREGDTGEVAAHALAAALARQGIAATHRVLARAGPPDALAHALRGAGPTEALVLWLRPADLQALPPEPPQGAHVLVSGLMGGLERAPLPPAWRAAALMTEPFDLPERRIVRVDYALGWFTLRKVPIVAPRIQADTYLACGLLSEALNHSVDVTVREYLLERLEDMIEHRLVTGYYPRLSLAPGQRFASKGGYLVRFVGPAGQRVVADGGWTVP
jgi:hypothetical protein